MTAVLVEKAMLETYIGEKSIVDKSVHIFQTLGKVVRTVQHAWKSSPHFFSTRENVFPFSAYIDSKGLYGIRNPSPPTTPRRNFRSGKLTSEKWSRQISFPQRKLTSEIYPLRSQEEQFSLMDTFYHFFGNHFFGNHFSECFMS